MIVVDVSNHLNLSICISLQLN